MVLFIQDSAAPFKMMLRKVVFNSYFLSCNICKTRDDVPLHFENKEKRVEIISSLSETKVLNTQLY